IGGVRIERGHHAADGRIHQLAVADPIDVIAFDMLVDFREEARFLPGKGRGIAGIMGARPLRQHAASESGGKAENRPRDESDQRALAARHVMNPPVGSKYQTMLRRAPLVNGRPTAGWYG